MQLYADSIWFDNAWHKDVTLTIDSQGFCSSLSEGRLEGSEQVTGVILPGMPNLHSHAFQYAMAGLTEYRGNPSDSFWSWRELMYRFVADMTPEKAHQTAKALYGEMLKQGYTCVGEFHYLHHDKNGSAYDNPAEMSDAVIQAAQDVGLAITHLPVFYSYAGFGEQPLNAGQQRFYHTLDAYQHLVESLIAKYQASEQVKIGIAPHSLRAVSAGQLEELVSFISTCDAKAPIHIHIAEQIKEVDDCLAFYGQRPVDWLLTEMPVDERWCLVHATHLTEFETKALARSRAVAGICPTTEANLGDGVFPAKSFFAEEGRWGIGSDSHISVNAKEELRWFEYAQRLSHKERAILSSPEFSSVGQTLYLQAALGGAQALAQPSGSLQVGTRADLVVINEPRILDLPLEKIFDSWLFASNGNPINDVMVAGNWRVKDRELIV